MSISVNTSGAYERLPGLVVGKGKIDAVQSLPLPLPPEVPDPELILASGTWTKPEGDWQYATFYLFGGGGGGGSGACRTTSDASGGAGGGAGERRIIQVAADNLGDTESLVVGSGGGGGVAKTPNSNGNAGGSGQDTTLTITGLAITATAGGGGAGGGGLQSDSNSTGGAGGTGGVGGVGLPGGRGGDGFSHGSSSRTQPSSGGGGGACGDTGPTTPASGDNGASSYDDGGGVGGLGSTYNADDGVTDPPAGSGGDASLSTARGGGGGGGTNDHTTAGEWSGSAGGAGGFPGGGGGGGGGSRNSTTTSSGAGGAGAAGAVYVVYHSTVPESPFPDPSDVGGLISWLKADAITGLSDGDPVSTWQASVGGDGTQATSGNRPIYRASSVGGKPTVDFVSDDNINVPVGVALTTYTVFTVVRPDVVTSSHTIFSLDAGGYNNDLLYGIDPEEASTVDNRFAVDIQRASDSSRAIATDPSNAVAGTPYLIGFRYDGTNLVLYKNGVAVATIPKAPLPIKSGTWLMGINPNSGSGRGWDGLISETAIYNTAISDEDASAVMAGLMSKYGI